MAPTISSNNKRIAKNTLMLYIRMILIMGITFYTSRVVLDALGVEDYGIYNVVGGVIVLFSFINGSMTLATQRFFANCIGKNDFGLLRKTFCMSIIIHIILALIVLLLCETIGLWFIYNYLNIPAEKMNAAIWVYQFSIIACVFNIFMVPLTSLVIASEDMKIYAYISIVEALMRLAIAFMLKWIDCNKLILYGGLLAASSIIIYIIWFAYCNFKYKVSFAGWQLIGSFTWVLRTQGVNMILNIFFGAALNASRGIAVQVNSAVLSFVQNFQMASNPQINKYYASGDLPQMKSLIFRTSKLSFFLLLVFALPIIIYTRPIMELWLTVIPPDGTIFVRLMLIATLVDTLSGSLIYGILATGKIKNYQLTVCSFQILEVVFVYIAFKLGYSALYMFYTAMIVSFISFLVRLKFLEKTISLNIMEYFKTVTSREVITYIIALIIGLILHRLFPDNPGLTVLALILTVISTISMIFLIGLDKDERKWITSIVNNKLNAIIKF